MADEISLVFDTETDGLRPTLLHCLAVRVVNTGESFLFADHPGYLPLSEGLALLESADWLIAHNGFGYDVPVLEKLYPGIRIDRSKVLDTLDLARSYFKDLRELDAKVPDMPKDLIGKNSLKAWGYRLGLHKGDFGATTDWKVFTREMGEYCLLDVDVTALLYEVLMRMAVTDHEAQSA